MGRYNHTPGIFCACLHPRELLRACWYNKGGLIVAGKRQTAFLSAAPRAMKSAARDESRGGTTQPERGRRDDNAACCFVLLVRCDRLRRGERRD